MRSNDEHMGPDRACLRLILLAAAMVVLGCASSGRGGPAETAIPGATGFTVVDDVRIGIGVRGDFEEALRTLEEEDYERGIELLLAVAEDVPKSTIVRINLAIAYGMIGDLEHADASIDEALVLNPRHPAAHNERGILHRRSGRFAEARKSYETALSLFPDFHPARRNLAILCDLYLSDSGCALEHYQAYLDAVPGDELAPMWIADLSSRSGR